MILGGAVARGRASLNAHPFHMHAFDAAGSSRSSRRRASRQGRRSADVRDPVHRRGRRGVRGGRRRRVLGLRREARASPRARSPSAFPGFYALVRDKWRIDELYEETVHRRGRRARRDRRPGSTSGSSTASSRASPRSSWRVAGTLLALSPDGSRAGLRARHGARARRPRLVLLRAARRGEGRLERRPTGAYSVTAAPGLGYTLPLGRERRRQVGRARSSAARPRSPSSSSRRETPQASARGAERLRRHGDARASPSSGPKVDKRGADRRARGSRARRRASAPAREPSCAVARAAAQPPEVHP